jgi:hypothetical protein
VYFFHFGALYQGKSGNPDPVLALKFLRKEPDLRRLHCGRVKLKYVVFNHNSAIYKMYVFGGRGRYPCRFAGFGGVRVARWFIFKPKIPIWIDFGLP